jgi:multidrug efflux pump subunit AcrA (membrane-fusion protein)
MTELGWKRKDLSLVELFTNIFMPERKAGYIKGLFVKDGDMVEQGQKLAEVFLSDFTDGVIYSPEDGVCRNVYFKVGQHIAGE